MTKGKRLVEAWYLKQCHPTLRIDGATGLYELKCRHLDNLARRIDRAIARADKKARTDDKA